MDRLSTTGRPTEEPRAERGTRLSALVALALLGLARAAATQDEPPATEGARGVEKAEASDEAAVELASEDVRFFESEVRPLLEAECFECHGPDAKRARGGLRMTGTESLLAGGDRGPALDAQNPSESRFLLAIRYTDDDLEMPPAGRLTDDEIATFEDWIGRGAPWPDYGELEPLAREDTVDVAGGRAAWAFRPVERPAVPATRHADRVRNPIDAFVFARLEEAGLEPGPLATPRELVRRAYFNLIGLPPTRAAVEAFEADPSDEAWARLVDELLARPEYGERWARHWLDVVRFAQTNGYERDVEKPYAWRYRDYVVDAFNEDKPYDRFLSEQLAGDEFDDVTTESLIATGFYRIGAWDDEPDDEAQAEYDNLDDVLRTISEGMMGVTLGCARCHDHKFDPFPQEDYYTFLAFLRSIDPYKAPQYALDSPMMRMLGTTPGEVDRWKEQREARVEEAHAEMLALRDEALARCMASRVDELEPEIRALFEIPAAERTTDERDRLWEVANEMFTTADFRAVLTEDENRELGYLSLEKRRLTKSFEGDVEWALVVSDVGGAPVPTLVLVQGRASSPKGEVEPGFVRVLCPDDEAARPGDIDARPRSLPEEISPGHPGRGRPSTGRRLALARWITSPEHPLTARVLVNRVWHHQFGRGIVATPNDFGQTGSPPTHPELVDWLASHFVASGWSIKELQRQILTSYTWRMSSRVDDAAAVAVDPDNRLLWRQNLRRLDAEALRDATLAVAGVLNPRAGGRGFFPELSREALSGMSRPGSGWEPSSAEERARRSVYAYVKRGTPVPLFVAFDQALPNLPVGARATTTVAPQALTLMNSDFMGARAADLARRALSSAEGDPARAVDRVFELALTRPPSAEESTLARDYVARLGAALRARELPLSFRPKVPIRLDVGYLQQLEPEGFLYGPREGWSYARGDWGDQYNDTREQHPARGPFALHDHAFEDGTIETRVRFGHGLVLGSLFVRAAVQDDLPQGLELVFLPQDDAIELRDHGFADEPSGAPTVLARAAFDGEPEVLHDVSVELAGPTLTLVVDGQRVLTADGLEPRVGRFGARAVGATLELSDTRLKTSAGTLALRHDRADAPDLGALEALALVVLNTNEFLYVD